MKCKRSNTPITFVLENTQTTLWVHRNMFTEANDKNNMKMFRCTKSFQLHRHIYLFYIYICINSNRWNLNGMEYIYAMLYIYVSYLMLYGICYFTIFRKLIKSFFENGLVSHLILMINLLFYVLSEEWLVKDIQKLKL